MRPGTDPAALRFVTTVVLAGLVMAGVAVALRGGLAPAGGSPARRPPAGQAPGGTSGPAQAAGLKLLAQAAQACRSVSYQGMEVAWWGPGGGTASAVDVWHQHGGQALTQTATSAAEWPGQPRQAVPFAGGGSQHPDGNGVLGMSPRLVALLGANFLVAAGGRGQVADRPAQIVTVRRHDGSLAAWFWLDRATSLPLRREMFDARAHLISDVAFAEVKIGRGAVARAPRPAARPWRNTLASAQLAVLRSRGWPLPGPLPGLTLLGAKENTTSAGPVVDLDYSDGLSVVSIFVQRGYLPARLRGWSQVALQGHRVYANDPDDLSFAWSARGFVYTLIAAAPRQTVGAVVAALPHDDGAGLLTRMKHGLHRLLSWVSP